VMSALRSRAFCSAQDTALSFTTGPSRRIRAAA
jgi:hypothetical protein